MSDREEFYDETIAPKLLEIGKLCEDNGLSFHAVVEWEPGEYGSTAAFVADHGFALDVIRAAAQANANVDALIFALMKHARNHGHSSICLHQLGVPTEPAAGVEVREIA